MWAACYTQPEVEHIQLGDHISHANLFSQWSMIAQFLSSNLVFLEFSTGEAIERATTGRFEGDSGCLSRS